MNSDIHLVSSMATREILRELASAFSAQSGRTVELESAGGVDVLKRVQAGEAFDLVALASGPIDQLITEGFLARPGRIDLAHSNIGIAVKAGAVHPKLGNAAQLKDALLQARAIGYSTGPSGTYLLKMFTNLGIYDAIKARLLQAPAGVPVTRLLAQGEVSLGLQQISELIGAPGTELAGPLPDELQSVTTFSAAASVRARHPAATQQFLSFLDAPAADGVKRRYGMDPVRGAA